MPPSRSAATGRSFAHSGARGRGTCRQPVGFYNDGGGNTHDQLEGRASPHRRRRHRRAGRGLGAVAAGHPFAGHRAGGRVQGDRRRHPARPQRVPDVRRAGTDRAGQRARGVSQQSDHDGFGHRRGSHAHSARRRVPQEIPSSLRAHPSRRSAQSAARRLPQVQSHPSRCLAKGRQGRRHRWRHRGHDRKRQSTIAARL